MAQCQIILCHNNFYDLHIDIYKCCNFRANAKKRKKPTLGFSNQDFQKTGQEKVTYISNHILKLSRKKMKFLTRLMWHLTNILLPFTMSPKCLHLGERWRWNITPTKIYLPIALCRKMKLKQKKKYFIKGILPRSFGTRISRLYTRTTDVIM